VLYPSGSSKCCAYPVQPNTDAADLVTSNNQNNPYNPRHYDLASAIKLDTGSKRRRWYRSKRGWGLPWQPAWPGRRGEEGRGYLDAEVAGADDVLDLAGHEHGLELGGQVGRPVRDVQIPQREHQHHPPRSRLLPLAFPLVPCP
jgi:hypothetical protein